MSNFKPIAESKRFIILEKYQREAPLSDAYQSENALERELIQDLMYQGTVAKIDALPSDIDAIVAEIEGEELEA